MQHSTHYVAFKQLRCAQWRVFFWGGQIWVDVTWKAASDVIGWKQTHIMSTVITIGPAASIGLLLQIMIKSVEHNRHVKQD